MVWYSRKSKRHVEEGMDIQTIVHKINAFIKRSHLSHSVYQISLQEGALKWTPPGTGFIKINCDGTWRTWDSNRWRVGAICRT